MINVYSAFEDYVPLRPVLSFTERDETGSIICTNIATILDDPNAPVVENTEDYLVTYESNIEIEMLGSSNMTVYITDEDGELKQFKHESSSTKLPA